MAIGDVTTIAGSDTLIAIEVLASETAVNSPPANATAGIAVRDIISAFGGQMPQDLSLVVVSTAGSGTMTVTIRQWLMFGTLGSISAGAWCPAGPGGDATKGVINAGAAIGETGSNTIRHCEVVTFTAHASRLYFEITAIGGTGTAVTVFLVGRKGHGVGIN